MDKQFKSLMESVIDETKLDEKGNICDISEAKPNNVNLGKSDDELIAKEGYCLKCGSEIQPDEKLCADCQAKEEVKAEIGKEQFATVDEKKDEKQIKKEKEKIKKEEAKEKKEEEKVKAEDKKADEKK